MPVGATVLYRIVKLAGCPEGDLSQLNVKAFSVRKERELSLVCFACVGGSSCLSSGVSSPRGACFLAISL